MINFSNELAELSYNVTAMFESNNTTFNLQNNNNQDTLGMWLQPPQVEPSNVERDNMTYQVVEQASDIWRLALSTRQT